MPERIVPLTPDNYYHIYNRGVNRGLIFYSDRNYQFFIDRMLIHIKPNSDILAFCLMPNHFHLLIRVDSPDFVEEALRPFLLSYAKAINREQDRIGPLFQGRFQANLVEGDEHLLDCVKYIHLNPVKANLVKTPDQWKYSSYSNYLGKSKNVFINTSIILNFFDSLSEFINFTESGMEEFESNVYDFD
jgi:putative transposase